MSWQLAQQYPQRSWQHQNQLQQLNSVIAGVTIAQQQITKISNNQASLEVSIKKQSESVQQLNSLLTQLAQLRAKVSVKIRQKVNLYIEEQGELLAEHLLSTRQGMATVLERMAVEDKRLLIKLAPAMAGAH